MDQISKLLTVMVIRRGSLEQDEFLVYRARASAINKLELVVVAATRSDRLDHSSYNQRQ